MRPALMGLGIVECMRAHQCCRVSLVNAVFLDKLCIHQTDPERKKKAIQSLGAFLMQSREMVILWDRSYFQRMWCVFEVAVFLSLCPATSLTLVP